MTRDEFIAAGVLLYGKHWRQRMSEALHVEPSTVSRWASGATDVLPVAAVAVGLLLERRATTLSQCPSVAPVQAR